MNNDNVNFKPISLTELMNTQFIDTKWIIEKLIPSGTIVAVSGQPSAYKTWIILDLSIKVARGEVLFDKFLTTKTGVFIVDEETGDRWIQERVSKLQKTYDLPVYILSKKGFKLTDESIKLLIDFAKGKNIGLIIFDSLLRIHTARDENDAVQMAKVFSLFQQFTKEGITVIFTHHHRKQGILRGANLSQDMRGSSDILAAVDCHLAVERKENNITITQTKLRQGEEIKPFQLNIVKEENNLRFEFVGEVNEEQTKKLDFKEAIKDLLDQENKPMYKKEMFETLKASGIDGGYSTFKIAVQEMIDKQELFEQRGEKNKVFCSLKPVEQNKITLNENKNTVS